MNFLAHLYFSAGDSDIQIGNFIGDFVRGRDLSTCYSEGIVKGILLHRAIDEFTDHHPIVKQSKNRLRAKYGHYAPVIIDIFYDHFLAINWHLYHPQTLPEFAHSCYANLERNLPFLPEKVNQLWPYMKRENWLVNYAKIEGIQKTLNGMSKRSKFDSKLNESTVDLVTYYSLFNEEFQLFFPELQNYTSTFLANY